ncbi:peptide/nickel transport system ATP-binding protein/oligopeptide transport system ATP-binding protein/dipeptide transport system ATP-binding protein [Amycolatopsis sacchari]|uniref:Peptide/nickel transport system ATP-binding protein/oligopeptide transport system ATP-binding protein/dipeptide transport system ATP-binding protein n=1 Tax=Amycolatopsis sacchari TaxID=115433 RepID=A0A1I3UZB2_9PSEU|nr:ABC transporter ATP-binding protein [Amycolatopsis sacchari]SFJ88558.1 peptide/nickel transport system ATP-binding protein/oligopeptide transport system ATP-binding protein/dipeptide transport system ATP-binding protein [Amycolatopsis sacchari]
MSEPQLVELEAPAAAPAEVLLSVRDLKVGFKRGGGVLEAVHSISFDLGQGEALGIVGESGSGKSVTALALLRLLDPKKSEITGEVALAGRNLVHLNARELRKTRGRDVGFVFQDPLGSLNPAKRIEQQLTEPLRLHGLTSGKADSREQALEMLRLVGISDPRRRLRQYPHELSGGMRQRVMIAGAIITRPRLVILDEPTTALDVTIQAQILDLLSRLRVELGTSMLLISHDLGVVAQVADRVSVMYAGRIVESGSTQEVLDHPRHPYTRGLIASRPRLDSPLTEPLVPIPGQPPALEDHAFDACSFQPRCPHAVATCKEELPLLAGQPHPAACWVANSSSGARR